MNNGWFWFIQLPVGILMWIFCLLLIGAIVAQVTENIWYWWKYKRKRNGETKG